MPAARSILIANLMALFISTSALAVPTHITVRVKAKDAKFMGTEIGGALVTIKDAQTGELLAKGVTEGASGNTTLIMKTPHVRGVPISDQNTAKFEATIDIDEPRYVEVAAYGPLSQRQSANTASVTQWVVPGKHINAGDAWLIELRGLLVNVQSPSTPTSLEGVPQRVRIEARVTMQCGCPLTPGGVWDADRFEIKALLKKDGKSAGALDMKYAGSPTKFEGFWNVTAPGNYEAVVYAYDPSNGNTGLDRLTFSVN